MDLEKEQLTAEDYYTELSSRILEFTRYYFNNVLRKILKEQEYVEEPYRFYYTVMNKTLCSLDAMNYMIVNFDRKRNYHSPLFILIRAIVADLIIVEYLVRESRGDYDVQKKIIQTIYIDHVENIVKSKKTLAAVNNWTEEYTDEKISELKAQYTNFYTNDGKTKIQNLKASPRNLVKHICSTTSSSEDLIFMKKAYHIYDKYSKLEHLGEFSFPLTHMSYGKSNICEIAEDLHVSVRMIVAALINYSTTWDMISDDTVDEMRIMEEGINMMSVSRINEYVN